MTTYSRSRRSRLAINRAQDYNSLPQPEQNGGLPLDIETNDREVERYDKTERVRGVLRVGRIRDAWNRCGVWAIYGVFVVSGLLIMSFVGGLVIAPYLPEGWVNTDLVFKVLDWALAAFKEVVLVLAAFAIGLTERKFDLLSNIVNAASSSE